MATKYFISTLLVIIYCGYCYAQKSDLVEGGKTLVELIRVIKTPKKNSGIEMNNNNGQNTVTPADSCAIKKQSDLCYKNNSNKNLAITIFKRIGNAYELTPFTMKVISNKQECWFELNAGIYRYRIETDDNGNRLLQAEGEFKLEPCDNMTREINN